MGRDLPQATRSLSSRWDQHWLLLRHSVGRSHVRVMGPSNGFALGLLWASRFASLSLSSLTCHMEILSRGTLLRTLKSHDML